MVPLKIAIMGTVSRSNPNNGAFRFFFSTGIASRLFVKGISFSSTETSLAEAFSKFGKIVQVNIVRDKSSNKSKGYGYVTFSTEDEAKEALIQMNGKVIDGRSVFVDTVSPKSGSHS